MLSRLRNLLDEAATGVGVLVGIYPHREEAEHMHPADVIAQQGGQPDVPSQRRDRDPPDAVHVYKAQRALRRLQPFLEGDMQTLGSQAFAHLGSGSERTGEKKSNYSAAMRKLGGATLEPPQQPLGNTPSQLKPKIPGNGNPARNGDGDSPG